MSLSLMRAPVQPRHAPYRYHHDRRKNDKSEIVHISNKDVCVMLAPIWRTTIAMTRTTPYRRRPDIPVIFCVQR